MTHARKLFTALALSLAVMALSSPRVEAQSTAPPSGDFQKVSELVELPDFVPGLGVLYVNPSTLPAGPFLGYDRDGDLVNTTYMVPLDDLNAQESFRELDSADAPVDHVDVVFNAGHPGLPEPHYHVVLWHVSPRQAASLGG